MTSWTAAEELQERLAAIEAVSHAHPGTRVVEHLLVSLVDFLKSGRLSRSAAVQALIAFIGAEPPRVGAVETLEFVMASEQWPELRAELAELRHSESADYRNRDLARSALAAGEPGWHGGSFRSFEGGGR